MRNTLIEWLTEKAKYNEEVMLITGDLGYSVLEPFMNLHSDRFINIGVAEQNMAGIAAGLALEGFRPYTYSIGIFPTFRCAEQIRNDIDYHDLPVVICSIGSGVAYGNLGYSHHAIQDLALMRSLPNMMIGTPSDPKQVIEILNYQFDNPKPLYLRLHKAGERNLVLSDERMIPGGLRRVIESDEDSKEISSKDTCILCIGHIADKVIKLCNEVKVTYPIFTVPLWGSPSSEYYVEQIKRYKTIITVEDHVLEGGFGSYTLEMIAKNKLGIQVIPITLQREVIGKVAKEETLLNPLIEELKEYLVYLANQ